MNIIIILIFHIIWDIQLVIDDNGQAMHGARKHAWRNWLWHSSGEPSFTKILGETNFQQKKNKVGENNGQLRFVTVCIIHIHSSYAKIWEETKFQLREYSRSG